MIIPITCIICNKTATAEVFMSPTSFSATWEAEDEKGDMTNEEACPHMKEFVWRELNIRYGKEGGAVM